MGSIYDVATRLEELGSCHKSQTFAGVEFVAMMKRVKVPNLAHIVKSELLVAAMGRERPTIPALHDQRLYWGSIKR